MKELKMNMDLNYKTELVTDHDMLSTKENNHPLEVPTNGKFNHTPMHERNDYDL